MHPEESVPQIPICSTIFQTNPSTLNSLKNDLSNIAWDEVLSSNDIDNAYDKFIYSFINAYDNNCILKKKKRKQIPRKPWITYSLLKCIVKKDKLYKIFCTKRNELIERKFKRYRNKLNAILKRAKKQYYCDLLQKHKNNLSKVWKIINDLIGRNKNKTFQQLTL